MTPAAFRAVYSDWKLIRTRGVVQLVFEVPIHDADAAYQAVGGMPDQAKSVWCAVARIEEPKEAAQKEVMPNNQPTTDTAAGPHSPSPEDRPHLGKSYAQRIAIACDERAFQVFLSRNGHPSINDKDGAADAVRKYCEVKSRREIREGTKAGNRWLILQSGYRAWMDGPRAGVS